MIPLLFYGIDWWDIAYVLFWTVPPFILFMIAAMEHAKDGEVAMWLSIIAVLYLFVGLLFNVDYFPFILCCSFWFVPPLVLIIIGVASFRANRKAAMRHFIVAVIYLLIGGGICRSIMTGFG